MSRVIVIAAGGTGGHVIPGLAVGQALRERGHQVHWLGTATGIESRLVPEADIPLHLIKITGFRGKGVLTKLLLPFRLLGAVLQARKQLRALRADAVVAMGGFVAGPTGMAARWLGLPVIVQEQNAVAGTTNRLLSRWAKRVLTAFPQAFPERGELLGNPVRADIAALPAKQTVHQPINLLVLGGSLGADVLNRTVPAALALLDADKRPQVCHQCGSKNVAVAEQAYAAAGVTADIRPYIDDMVAAYEQADIMVCRAGALTVAEVAAAGVPAIFVPLPHAIDDHQTANAKSLSAVGAAWLMPQAELTAEYLAAQLETLMAQPDSLLAVAAAAKAEAKPNATQAIADVIENVLEVGVEQELGL